MNADAIPQAVQHIVAVQKFLTSQRRALPVTAYVQIEAGQRRAVLAVTDQLATITAADANTLTEALDEYNWDADAATALRTAIGTRVNAVAPHVSSSHAVTQRCDHFYAYPTETEYSALRDPSCTRLRRVHIAVDRMHAIGLSRPSEHTRKHIDGVIGMYEQHPSGKDICDDIKFWLKKKNLRGQQSTARQYTHRRHTSCTSRCSNTRIVVNHLSNQTWSTRRG